ncbi:MAG: hypothetical protein ACOY4N_12930 [Pseudomonadota bacterium]|uniref:hypothetical protein n=1 Tax=Sphingobium TaxID=165695 RepID=UPI00037A7737|nr:MULTISPECIES: hypothetical protein [Sphingobium]QWT13164.1 hypothetical protein GTV57_10595 [Sphingobium xenophagum]
MDEGILGPIVGLAVSTIAGWQLLQGFRGGIMQTPYWGFTMTGRRQDQPFRFWLLTLLLAFWMICGMALCIGVLFFPNGIAT